MSGELLHSHGPGNVATLITTTHEARRTDVKDTVFSKRVLLDYLNRKAKVMVDGGASIVGNLMTGKNTAVGSYDDDDTLNITHQEGHTTYQYPWKQYYASINIFGREERVQNQGKNQIMNIATRKLDQADTSLADDLNTDMFAAVPAAKDTNSLVTLIDATSVIGGIDSTANSFWQSEVVASGTFAGQGLDDMRTLWYELSKRNGGGDPDLLLTTSEVFGFYEKSLTPQQRYTQTENGQASFQNLLFKNSPMMFDSQATTGVMYFLNSDVMEFVINSGTNFELTDWEKPADQDIRVAQILFAGELITTNRRKLGKLTGIIA